MPDSPQSHRLAAWYPELLSAGARATGEEALTYTQEMKETTNVLCVARGKRNYDWYADMKGARLVSPEARMNVRAATEAADLTSLP